MILCVGDSVKLGHLREALEQRLHQEVTFLPAAPDIRRQENDILLAAQGTDAIIYDTDAYYNDGEELIGVIKRIWRTNHAAPILLVPTDNPKNEIVKAALAVQIKNIINVALSPGEQKDQLEKILTGYYAANGDRKDIRAAEDEVAEDPDRLNRHIENHFGSEDYAREELRAEIASAFVSQELGLEMSQKALNEHFDLHKAYIQSWIKVLEKDPQELFAAIKDASGIANYLMEKGEFLQNITEEKRQIRHIEAENIDQEKFDFYAKDPVDLRFVGCTFRNVTVSESEARLSQFKDCKFYGCDTRSVQDRSVFTHAAFFPADAAVRQPERRESKYIPADMIELARSQDVFDILQRTGEPLFQKDGQWRSVEHDSLVVTPGKGYYWFSRAEGSKSPIDYFVNVHGMGFQEAVRTVLEAIHRDVTYTPPVWLPPAEHEEFRPLPRAKTNLDAYNYLVQERGLDQELVDGLMRQGRIYQSGKYKNVVFVGTDFDGVVASNFARSCDPTQQVQRFDVRGSQKEYRFRMENPDCPRCNVFESEIDLLSYLSMRPADQRTENYIALGGVSPRALLAFLQYRPDVSQINLCTDGDRAGEQCAESIRTLLEGQYEISREAAPIGKDWNESLVRIRELQESWEHETNDPETETWRDDLTSQEAQIVAAWDDGFDHGLARMVTLSRTQDDPGLRSAMAKLDPVEQVRSPFARKAEDWTY